jgi:beta-galactosidase
MHRDCQISRIGIRLVACFAVLGWVAIPAQSQRIAVSLDPGWRFHSGVTPEASASAFDDNSWAPVNTPHMFPYEMHGSTKSVYRGEAWYRKTFTPPDAWKGKRIFLRFDAVAIVSDTWLNGARLGEHRGGFAAFTYEMTNALHMGEPNQLAVRVDDRMNPDVAPQEISLMYGGIYRHVSLIVTGPVAITPMDLASPGVFLTQTAVSAAAATVQVRTEIDSGLVEARPVSVRILLIDGAGKPLFKTTSTGPAAPGKITPVTQIITIPNPHLWQGVADPYVYSVRIDLLDGTEVIDSVVQPLGLRSFHFDPKRGFSLNGIPEQIHGVCLHQDWGDRGWAVGPEQEKQDLQILRERGVDGLRLVHYQHSQSALDLYDRTGMLVWSELAQFGNVTGSEAYKQNARQQLEEMIRQSYNHPSIIMWSLFNELTSRTRTISGPIIEDLNQLAHTEDPVRPTVGASHGDMLFNEHETVVVPDLIAENNYAGWYFGAPVDMLKSLSQTNANFDGRGLGVSEYGAGARITDHKQGLSVTDTKPVDPYGKLQPEEWQALVHEGNYAAIRSLPYIWGSFIWLSFDTGGIPYDDGHYDGGNIKGLVTQDRRTRKDAYFFYQANWTVKPMLYLTSRRDTERTDPKTAVKVYSNAAAVTLTVNGRSYGEQKPDAQHILRWKSIALSPGRNRVEVSTPDGLHDEAMWTLAGGASRNEDTSHH